MLDDIKKKAEEKANEVKDATSNVGSKVAEKAKNLGESASELAGEAAKTASDAASSAGKMARSAIDSVVITVATKIVISSMKKVGKKGTSYIHDDSKYSKFVDRTWEMLPLPVRLVGKESLGYNSAMFTLRNTVFGKEEDEPKVDEEDEGFIKSTIMGMFR
ncbi:MAG: hypothetical protein QF895_05585 [SAR86 cluster bacterium]|nr:hypothetical protein [SAR86 cluster bacterium]